MFALLVVRLENFGGNRTVDATMHHCRQNTWHTHIWLGYMGVRTLTRCDFSLLEQGGLWPFNRYVQCSAQVFKRAGCHLKRAL